MHLKSVIATASCAMAIAAVGAGAASAGEITGPSLPGGIPDSISNPTPALDVAQSICAASGLNHLHEGEFPNRTQSYGQLVRFDVFDPSLIRNGEPAPGSTCNGHTGIFATGG
jgi:hypothetical protein